MLFWQFGLGVAASLWLIIWLLPWQPWRNREVLNASVSPEAIDLKDLTVVIPARNEAALITTTLQALIVQGHNLNIILVDDHSSDKTVQLAESLEYDTLTIVQGQPLPEGWTGKLWAQEQGVQQVKTPLTLLLDADIKLTPGLILALLDKKQAENLQFVSLMASLSQVGIWEKWFMPAFVYFFKMLYPFALANSPRSFVAAAAGGCILLDTQIFAKIGGLASIRGAIIDDCTLAGRVKSEGYRTWLGLTHSVISQRASQSFADIWDMVARTAFTQLRYSTALLLLCTGVMLLMYWLPVLGLFVFEWPWVQALALFACVSMALCYWPTLKFYHRHPLWCLTMPLIAGFYLAMVWGSAIRYWKGEKTRWKGRIYHA